MYGAISRHSSRQFYGILFHGIIIKYEQVLSFAIWHLRNWAAYQKRNIVFIYNRDLGQPKDQSTNSPWDQKARQYVQRELKALTLDSVSVQEYYTAVTYPDPTAPNRLEVIDATNTTVLNITLVNDRQSGSDVKPPCVVRSASGVAKVRFLKWVFADDCRFPFYKTRGPKGHISCTWVQCATFF